MDGHGWDGWEDGFPGEPDPAEPFPGGFEGLDPAAGLPDDDGLGGQLGELAEHLDDRVDGVDDHDGGGLDEVSPLEVSPLGEHLSIHSDPLGEAGGGDHDSLEEFSHGGELSGDLTGADGHPDVIDVIDGDGGDGEGPDGDADDGLDAETGQVDVRHLPGVDPDRDPHADDAEWSDPRFPDTLDLVNPPEPVDGYPWSDPDGLGDPPGGVDDPTTHGGHWRQPTANELASFDGLAPGGDDAAAGDSVSPREVWDTLLRSEDPATGALARWWAPGAGALGHPIR